MDIYLITNIIINVLIFILLLVCFYILVNKFGTANITLNNKNKIKEEQYIFKNDTHDLEKNIIELKRELLI